MSTLCRFSDVDAASELAVNANLFVALPCVEMENERTFEQAHNMSKRENEGEDSAVWVRVAD